MDDFEGVDVTNPTCTVPGCDKPGRSPRPRTERSGMCPMHYHRAYRHGSHETTAVGQEPTGLGRRYRTVSRPGHPLAGPSGRIYEHRLVLFAMIGPGEHRCHWCGCTLIWGTRGQANAIQVDHLNADGSDNRPSNLVPSCAADNTARAGQHRADVLRQRGWWSSNDTIARLSSGGRRSRVEAA